MDLQRAIGLEDAPHEPGADGNGTGRRNEIDRMKEIDRMVELQLAANGSPPATLEGSEGDGAASGVPDGAVTRDPARALLANFLEKSRLLEDYRCPADRRIEAFLADHFADLNLPEPLRLPGRTLVLDRHGVARELSLPAQGTGDDYVGPLVSSYRCRNGVLHNPKSDRRTTAGTFHVTEGGLPIPADKKAVPKHVFAELFRRAVKDAPEDLMCLPFHSACAGKACTFVSLLLRPTVCPEVSGFCPAKTMETRFFAPGSLVSNLDFVESIFGNAGDPYLPENDAALDVEHWTGHTGCVVLATHLTEVTKKQAGLPHVSQATERQKRDRMCWEKEDEKYNDGRAFKLTCRTEAGVIITLIADSYYGYCKKEVKTQLSYAANLYGNVEEEHAGGALAFASYSLGEEFQAISQRINNRTFADVARDYGGTWVDVRPEGYGVDKVYPDLVYVPEDAFFSLPAGRITWEAAHGKEQSIALLAGKVYMTPSGYKVRIEKHPGAPSWRLIGTVGEGVNCHKPCTVSGGGKSEISKSIVDYMLYGPIFIANLERDLDFVQQIFDRDYSTRWKDTGSVHPNYAQEPTRPILSPKRSLGSVIKLLTPSPDYTDEYNAWLASIPSYVYPLVFIIKRFQRPEWGESPRRDEWRKWFGVDIVNGFPGNELKYGERKLVGTYLRVGLLGRMGWRTFKVRQDFAAAAKVQTQDDITASVVVPAEVLTGGLRARNGLASPPPMSYKFVTNCEFRLFQRPDDAIHRGLDKQTEADLSRSDNFISNFQPLTRDEAKGLVERAAEFDRFSPPMQRVLREACDAGPGACKYVVSSSDPRLVDGTPTKNPRYLQTRPDLVRPLDRYVAERGARLSRAVPADKPVYLPVDAVLVGRRNNPPDSAAGIRPLAVYNPIHYQELPELFMEFICSLTGKSPSTTGAGSEGALTKGPFNALRPAADLNNALVSYILTGLAGFSSAAGHVGPKVRVDHDISLLIPEVWCRLSPNERDPAFLIAEGHLEPLEDFDHDGHVVHASRLGYRITHSFVRTFFGRVFDNPAKVFDEAILKPETQDLSAFVDGIQNITDAQQRVAAQYFEDGSADALCPPLRAIVTIMAHGQWDGKTAHDPEVRRMFTLDHLLSSDWYNQRLRTKQQRDATLWRRHRDYLRNFLARPMYADEAKRLRIEDRLRLAESELARASAPEYLKGLVGTLGAHPF